MSDDATPGNVPLSDLLGAWPSQGSGCVPAEPKPGCADCRFAGPREGYDSYTCRRHAPITIHDPSKNCGVHQDAFLPRWPLMSGRDWCGDFERA